MTNKITCPKCGEEIELTDAINHELAEIAEKKATEKYEERNKKLTSQISDMLDEIRNLKNKDEEREIEMKKKLFESEEKIRFDARKKLEEEHELKDKEKEKLIDDLKKSLEDAQRKATQGSQQTQGESLELTLESKLKSEFPTDIISEVKKGQRGADIVQEVVDKLGRKCGVILWESKNAQWSESWIEKLKEDQRQAKADIAILISVNLPEDINNFAYKNGVWICSLSCFVALALSMRFNLISIYHEKQTAVGVDEKMKVLYQYLTGNEFKHRVEGIVEAFASMQDDLEKEKRWFSVKWARQEKEIRKVMDHTHGMYGDLQGVIGKSLPEISSLELSDGGR
ncbi:MAG TPA: DUF2130 domain-containing protein [Alphaproteobacteria bacterium]|nr:DUF2130 domain-containing protein [Alphaproteobacteria bacterium]